MLDRMPIGALPVEPEVLGYVRASQYDRETYLGAAKAYVRPDGKIHLFAPATRPRLFVPTIGHAMNRGRSR